MADSFVLLNDGTSFLLLNDGTSKVILNDLIIVPGVKLEGDHTRAQIGTTSDLRGISQKKRRLVTKIRTFSCIRLKRELRIRCYITRTEKMRLDSKIGRKSQFKLISRLGTPLKSLNIEARIIKKSLTEVFAKIPRYIKYKHEHLNKKQGKLDELKKLYDTFKELDDNDGV